MSQRREDVLDNVAARYGSVRQREETADRILSGEAEVEPGGEVVEAGQAETGGGASALTEADRQTTAPDVLDAAEASGGSLNVSEEESEAIQEDESIDNAALASSATRGENPGTGEPSSPSTESSGSSGAGSGALSWVADRTVDLVGAERAGRAGLEAAEGDQVAAAGELAEGASEQAQSQGGIVGTWGDFSAPGADVIQFAGDVAEAPREGGEATGEAAADVGSDAADATSDAANAAADTAQDVGNAAANAASDAADAATDIGGGISGIFDRLGDIATYGAIAAAVVGVALLADSVSGGQDSGAS